MAAVESAVATAVTAIATRTWRPLPGWWRRAERRTRPAAPRSQWERARATGLGLPVKTEEDLVAALFTEGLSTADRVSDVSGRGVGMGALRAAVLALGGSIDIVSERGRGTCLRLRVPAARDAPARLS